MSFSSAFNPLVIAVLLGFVMALEAMSADESGKQGHRVAEYGEPLPIVRSLGVGPAMDAAVVGDRLYVIGRGRLYVADITEPGAPKVLGQLGGLGNTRQIVVSRNVAYVTAREDGLFVVNVGEPSQPKLLCHYDPIELATGVAISGDVLFVACGTFGVELVDVSNPRRPVHLSTVRTGEAQSVAARDGWLYAGVWGTSELVVVNVKNPRKPTIAARAPLDDYGDGVDVRGNLCYVATGHHSRATPRQKEGDPGYGRGHGLEIFNISNPEKPQFVSRLKMPPFYSLGNDMWGVTVSGRYAFVADTFNGIFVVDVSEPKTPRFVAHRQLGYIEIRKSLDYVGGLAVGRDVVYVAGGYSDLHVVAAAGLAAPPTPEPDHPPVIPPREPQRDARWAVYQPDGQVYAVAFAGDTALVAADSPGLHVVQLWPEIKKLAEHPTEGFCMDVKVLGDRAYVAEGQGGLSIWGLQPLGRLGRYPAHSGTIKQAIIPPPVKYALLHVGQNTLHIVDVSDPSAVTRVLKDSRLGLLYGDQIADGLLEGRYACVFWHATGAYWYDLYGGQKPVYSGDSHAQRLDAQNGMAFLEHEALMTHRGKYFLLRRDERRPPDELPQYGVEGHNLNGKPCRFGNRLYISNRFTGRVSVLDIADIKKPKLLDSFDLEGNAGRIVVHRASFSSQQATKGC